MKKIKYLFASTAVMALPVLVSAQEYGIDPDGNAGGFLDSILTFTNEVLIPFIIAIGFLVFVWGMFQFFILGGTNDDAKAKGKSLMVYATLGFVLIIVFWGIINLLASATGLNDEFNSDFIPQVENL